MRERLATVHKVPGVPALQAHLLFNNSPVKRQGFCSPVAELKLNMESGTTGTMWRAQGATPAEPHQGGTAPGNVRHVQTQRCHAGVCRGVRGNAQCAHTQTSLHTLDLEVRCVCGWHTVAGARKVRVLEVPDSQPVVSIGAVPKHPRPPGHPRHPRCIAVCRVVLYVIRVVGTLSELQRLASIHKVPGVLALQAQFMFNQLALGTTSEVL